MVITGLTRNQLGSNPPRVRISPLPPDKRKSYHRCGFLLFLCQERRDSKRPVRRSRIATFRWTVAKVGCVPQAAAQWANLAASAKKEVTFVYQKLLLFLSKPQAWHIIAARSAVHIIKVGKPTLYLITRQRAFPCGLMIYRNKLRMICNSYGIDDIQGFALICSRKSSIMLLKGVVVCRKIIC